MIETKPEFSQKIAESSRQFRAKLLENNAEVPGTIRSITINKGACGAETFSVGSVYSSYIELVMDECDVALQDKEIQLKIGIVLDDETVEYATIGYYTVTKPTRTAYQLSFTAVGRIAAKLNILPDLPAVQTIDALAKAITAKTGVPIVFKGLTASGTIEENLQGLTCKEILQVITLVLGGFATEDSNGNIVVCKFSAANPINYNGDQTLALPEFKDYDYELYGVKVIVSEAGTTEDGDPIAEKSFTRGTPRMTVSTQYMTAALFETFANNVVGYTFRPGTVPLALGDPRLEPWDVLRFTDVKGVAYVVPCLSIVHTFDGGLSTVVTAPGESESEADTTQKGPLVNQVERIAAELVTAKEAIVNRLRADEILTDDIKAATGSFTKYLTGVKILGDLIEANTLKTDRLIIKGSDGKYYALNTDFTGLPNVTPVAEDAIHGSVLVRQSITAEQINVYDLFAENITSTGDFSMGGKGALVYDSKTDALTLRVKSLSVGISGKDTDVANELSNIGTTANDAKQGLEDLEVGGRNLIRCSENMMFENYYFYERGENQPESSGSIGANGGVSGSGNVLYSTGAKLNYVILYASAWEGESNFYSQVVSIEGVTENSQVDLTPSAEQLAVFHAKDLAFVTENDGGVITVYAIGQKPQNDYIIQVTITEVEYE